MTGTTSYAVFSQRPDEGSSGNLIRNRLAHAKADEPARFGSSVENDLCHTRSIDLLARSVTRVRVGFRSTTAANAGSANPGVWFPRNGRLLVRWWARFG